MIKCDVILTNLGGGDYGVYFVTPEFFDGLLPKEDESVEDLHWRRSLALGEAIERNDPAIVVDAYIQTPVVENLIPLQCNIKRILSMES
jgi:hypothetical protein